MGRHRLTLLGGFTLASEGREIELPASAQRLVAYLALNPHRLRRGHVAGVLWARGTEAHAAGCLRSALWRLRQADAEIVTASSSLLSLADGLVVDVWDVRAQTTRLLRPEPDRPDDLDPTTLTTELLPDWFDDWVLLEREQLRLMSLYALESICDQLLAMGRHAEASAAALAAVHSEPLRESAHRALIRISLAEGNASEALRQYHSYANLLRAELGLDPSEHMHTLVRGVRAVHAVLPAGRRDHD